MLKAKGTQVLEVVAFIHFFKFTLFLLCNFILEYLNTCQPYKIELKVTQNIFICFFLLNQYQLHQNHSHKPLCNLFVKNKNKKSCDNYFTTVLCNQFHLLARKYFLTSTNPLLQRQLITSCHWLKETLLPSWSGHAFQTSDCSPCSLSILSVFFYYYFFLKCNNPNQNSRCFNY